jgi:hypothetical protein
LEKKFSDALANFTLKLEEIASFLPENGKDADEELIIQKIAEMIKADAKEDTPEATRDRLETLQGDERLDKSAVKGLEEWFSGIQKLIETATFGRKGGNTNGGGVQSVVSTDGTVTIRSTMAKGKGVIDLSVLASGSYTLLLKTGGTIDDNNLDFTFASKPQEIVKNGLSYREGSGWSWDSGTLTATIGSPVGTGGDIYGRK